MGKDKSFGSYGKNYPWTIAKALPAVPGVRCASCDKVVDQISSYRIDDKTVFCRPCWRKAKAKEQNELSKVWLAKRTPEAVKKDSLAILREMSEL